MNEQVIRVLLIDDDEDDFILTRELFSLIKIGRYQLDWAPSYEEGLKVAMRHEHDVCLVDFSIGALNGVDLIRAAREARLTTPKPIRRFRGAYDIAAKVFPSRCQLHSYMRKHIGRSHCPQEC